MTATFIAIVLATVLQVTGPESGTGLGSSLTAAAPVVMPLAQVEVPADAPVSAEPDESDQTAISAAPSAPSDQPKAEEVDLSRGIAIALSGMGIVVVVLLLIIGFISSLPKILAVVATYFPESEGHHARKKSHPESQVAEDEAVLAAIGYVLHSRLNQDS